LYVTAFQIINRDVWQDLTVKYADDTNLLVPKNTDVPFVDEYAQIKDWAVKL